MARKNSRAKQAKSIQQSTDADETAAPNREDFFDQARAAAAARSETLALERREEEEYRTRWGRIAPFADALFDASDSFRLSDNDAWIAELARRLVVVKRALTQLDEIDGAFKLPDNFAGLAAKCSLALPLVTWVIHAEDMNESQILQRCRGVIADPNLIPEFEREFRDLAACFHRGIVSPESPLQRRLRSAGPATSSSAGSSKTEEPVPRPSPQEMKAICDKGIAIIAIAYAKRENLTITKLANSLNIDRWKLKQWIEFEPLRVKMTELFGLFTKRGTKHDRQGSRGRKDREGNLEAESLE